MLIEIKNVKYRENEGKKDAVVYFSDLIDELMQVRLERQPTDGDDFVFCNINCRHCRTGVRFPTYEAGLPLYEALKAALTNTTDAICTVDLNAYGQI